MARLLEKKFLVRYFIGLKIFTLFNIVPYMNNTYQRFQTFAPLPKPKNTLENSSISPGTSKLKGTPTFSLTTSMTFTSDAGGRPYWSPSCSPVKLGDWFLC